MNSVAISFHFISTFIPAIAAFAGFWVAVARPEFVPAGSPARTAFGVGWLLIGVGETLHGAEITPEPSAVTVFLRTAGYVLLMAGLVAALGTRPSRYTWLLVSVGLLAATEAAAFLAPSIHESSQDLLWWVFHSVRLLGGVAAGVWLYEAIRSSIQARFIASFVMLLLVVVLAISGATSQLFAANITAEALRRAERDGENQRRLINEQVAESVSRARQLAELESVRAAVAERNPVLDPTAQRLQSPGGAFDSSDFIAFFDPQGAILAISARGPDEVTNLDTSDAVSLAGAEVVRSALARRQAGSVDGLGTSKVALIGAYPIFNPPGADPAGSPQGLAGAVAVGRIINQRYLAQLDRSADEEVFLIARQTVLLGSTSRTGGVLPGGKAVEVFDEGKVIASQRFIGGTEYFVAYLPLQQTDDDVVAALVLGRRAGALAVARKEVARTVFVLALAATAAGGLLSLALASRVTRPIRRLTDAAQRVSAGDLNARVSPEGSDELAVLGKSFDQMTASISSLTSDLKRAAEEERRQRSSLETILQSLADGVIATDESGMVVAFNREAERILGTDAPSVMGRPVEQVLRLQGPDGRLLDGQVDPTHPGEMRASVAGGERPVAVTSAPIRDDTGRVIGGVAVLRDLTSEEELERMKTNFLSNVSHELRTPLTPIKGYSDILRRTKVPREKAVLYLDGIIEGAEKLERIVEMLIDFSAMEAGRLVVHKGPVDLDDLSAQLAQRWTKLAPRHRIERKGFRNLPRLELDRKLVRLALSELIDNAVKFSPDGGRVLISSSLGGRGTEATSVRITVADEGIGITPGQMSGITESFSQVDPSATRAFGGLGLGLAYVKRVAESHGGSLEAASQPKKGSKFTLVLPAEKSRGGG